MFTHRSMCPWIVVLALCAVCAGAGWARGDAFGDARKVFAEAQELYAAQDYAKAADKYTAAYRLIRSPLILFNIAQARRLQFKSDGDYQHLVDARRHYERFLADAEPDEDQRKRAEANLAEVTQDGAAEAKKQFAAAEKAMRLGKFDAAVRGYEAAYGLSSRPGLLFNLAQAERKQFRIDAKLERLARAEQVIIAYRREAEGAVTPEVIEEILAEIREERADYHRQREAEARAAEPPAMSKARGHYQRGEAELALAAIDEAARVEGNTRLVVIQIYRLRGQAAAQAGKTEVAVDAFKRYLALESAADGTGISTEAEQAFADAKAFWEGRRPLAIEHLPPGKVAPGKEVTIPVRVASDPLGMVAQLEIRYRRQGFEPWDVVALDTAADAAKLPRAPMPIAGKSYRMQYYVAALDEQRGVLDSLGSEKTPLAFLVTKDAIVHPPALYKRWWVWTAAAAIVAGSVVTYVIVSDDGLPSGLEPIGDLSAGAGQ
jgi:tetratricopeptide (TPR) repeat protein